MLRFPLGSSGFTTCSSTPEYLSASFCRIPAACYSGPLGSALPGEAQIVLGLGCV